MALARVPCPERSQGSQMISYRPLDRGVLQFEVVLESFHGTLWGFSWNIKTKREFSGSVFTRGQSKPVRSWKPYSGSQKQHLRSAQTEIPGRGRLGNTKNTLPDRGGSHRKISNFNKFAFI